MISTEKTHKGVEDVSLKHSVAAGDKQELCGHSLPWFCIHNSYIS